MKKAYIFLAEGFEDVEALGTVDVLRRGGVDVELVSITEDPLVLSSHGVTFGVDTTLEMGIDIDKDDIMVFPGGLKGAKNLAACTPLVEEMKAHNEEGGPIAAICAAPGLVLGQLDSLEGVKFTCYDGFENVPVSKGGEFVKKPTVTSGNIITGRGPGYAIDFGLELLKFIKGETVAEEVRSGMFIPCE